MCIRDRPQIAQISQIEEERNAPPVGSGPGTLPFALLLILTGVLLTLGPEFIYLRDNFGVRLNTTFKFYYQAWACLLYTSLRPVAGRRLPQLLLLRLRLCGRAGQAAGRHAGGGLQPHPADAVQHDRGGGVQSGAQPGLRGGAILRIAR